MRAFSLVEVLITVAIIGVVSAVAVPAVSSAIQREREASTAARVVDAIQNARETARSTLCRSEVSIAGGSLSVRSHKRPPDSGSTTLVSPSPCNSDRVEQFNVTDSGLQFGDFDFGHCPGSVMTILEDGSISDATAHVKLPMTLQDGRVWTVEIWPASGAVRLIRS